MHITVHCPGCYRRYQLDPQMQGRNIQCPNPVCRTVFEVRAEVEAKEESIYPLQPPAPENEDSTTGNPPPQKVSWSGSVGDLVPIFEAQEVPEALPAAEPAEIPEVEAPREAPSWHQPPPIRKQVPPPIEPERPAPAAGEPVPAAPPARESPPPRKKAPKTMMAGPEAPPEAPAQTWEPPPVRRTPDTTLPQETLPPGDWVPPVHDTEEDTTHAAGARRRSLWIIAVLSSVVVGLVGAGIFLIWSIVHKTEEELLAQAQQEYKEAKFAAATKTFTRLTTDFPNSESLALYKFFRDLSGIRSLVYSSDPQPDLAYEKLEVFIKDHITDELLKQRTEDVGETLLKVTEGLTDLADAKHDRRVLGQADAALSQARRFPIPGPSGMGKYKAAEEKRAHAEISISRWEVVQQLLADGKKLLQQPSDETVQSFRQRVYRAHADQNDEIKALLAQLDEAVRKLIRYVEAPKEPTPETKEIREPSLLVVPLVEGAKSQPPTSERVFLALARGVLYALAQSNGEVVWWTRVGIDTTSLPVRLPPTPTSPEMVLVVSADRNTLRALNVRTGQLLWEHELEQPCLGRPVVVRNRAYVPTYDGKVHEIEIVEGRRLGYFELGQPLTVGGAWQEGTDLLYFPGDSRNIYVLSMAEGAKGCVAILKSGHPSGSLRSEPILINRLDPRARLPVNQNAAEPSFLVLSQANGLTDMKLRVFQLPITQPDAAPVLLPEPSVRGWSWFQPYHDAEKLAFVTDAGILGLFGIRQIRNEDPALYPELKTDYQFGGDTTRPSRAQVVSANEQDFWVLANGDLQRLQLDKFRQELIPLWGQPLHLGLPLHARQVDETGNLLFVVTQSPRQQGCLATAVEAESGRIVWQRQLGVEVQGDPLVLGPEVLVLDRSGNLFAFDSRQAPRSPETSWQVGGHLVAAAPEEGLLAPTLVRSTDGTAVYLLATTSRGRRLLVRRVDGGPGDPPSPVPPRELPLPDTLGGTPGVTADLLILPLANGRLHQFALPLDGSSGEGGPDWRDPSADEGAPGYVVPFRENEFLVTNGSNGLKRLHWPKGPNPKYDPMKPVLMPARIIAPPIVLPGADPKDAVQVCVADADGVLTLLEGPELTQTRQWSLGGKITAGPFLRGGRIGCVIDQLRLVWLDPARKDLLWQYTMGTKGAQGIVGQPQLVGDALVVADVSGRFVSLDVATGRPRGPVYTLQASAAPAATPVAFGPDHALVPLSDGTLFLLPLAYLREPLRRVPNIW